MSQRARVSKRLAETESQWEPECELHRAIGSQRELQREPEGARE